MNRFDIARVTPEKPVSDAWTQIRSVSALTTISGVISVLNTAIAKKFCVSFLDTSDYLINRAVIKLSEKHKIPILVKSKLDANILSASYSYKMVYDLGTLPLRFKSAIFLKSSPGNFVSDFSLTPFLIII